MGLKYRVKSVDVKNLVGYIRANGSVVWKSPFWVITLRANGGQEFTKKCDTLSDVANIAYALYNYFEFNIVSFDSPLPENVGNGVVAHLIEYTQYTAANIKTPFSN